MPDYRRSNRAFAKGRRWRDNIDDIHYSNMQPQDGYEIARVSLNKNSQPVGRLAPSPTGAQHVGNARTYLLAWLSLRSRGGRVILRIEDIDSPRIKRGAAEQAIDDLRWLGLDWDEGPDIGGPNAPYIQTQRRTLYDDVLRTLKSAEQVYPCTCTRSDVQQAASAPHIGQEGPVYPRTCARRISAHAGQLAGQRHSWRFRTDVEPVRLTDRFAGPRECSVADELGDFVVSKADGTPAYQLAVVADDHAMGVTEVLRGDDLLPSAFRQLALYDFFGWQPPEFIHVPLVVGPDGRRLAKRHGDTRMATIRRSGVSAERLIGILAQSCGLRDSASPVSPHELLQEFDLSRIPKRPFIFDENSIQP